jgi:hypothetical protein
LPPECGAHDGQTSSTICRMGTTSSRRSIVVFGDSHSEMWMPAVLSTAQRDGWVVIPLSKSACTPKNWTGNSDTECHDWYVWAVAKAKAIRPDVVLVTGCCGGFTGSDADAVKEAFVSSAAALRPFSKRVVVVGDDLGINRQPVDCLLGRHATMKTCSTTWPDEQFFLNKDLAALAKIHHFGFVDTTGWFCFEHLCPMVVGHTIVYVDLGHITSAYAEELAAPFRASLRQALRQSAA